MNDEIRAEQMRVLFETMANFFAPETRPEYPATENRLIEICAERSDGSPTKDAAKAEQLEKVLTAAAARGEKMNLNVRSTSGVFSC